MTLSTRAIASAAIIAVGFCSFSASALEDSIEIVTTGPPFAGFGGGIQDDGTTIVVGSQVLIFPPGSSTPTIAHSPSPGGFFSGSGTSPNGAELGYTEFVDGTAYQYATNSNSGTTRQIGLGSFDTAQDAPAINDSGLAVFADPTVGTGSTFFSVAPDGSEVFFGPVVPGVIGYTLRFTNLNEVIFRSFSQLSSIFYPAGALSVIAGPANGGFSSVVGFGVSADGSLLSFAGDRGSGVGLFLVTGAFGSRQTQAILGEDGATSIESRIGVQARTMPSGARWLRLIFFGSVAGVSGFHMVEVELSATNSILFQSPLRTIIADGEMLEGSPVLTSNVYAGPTRGAFFEAFLAGGTSAGIRMVDPPDIYLNWSSPIPFFVSCVGSPSNQFVSTIYTPDAVVASPDSFKDGVLSEVQRVFARSGVRAFVSDSRSGSKPSQSDEVRFGPKVQCSSRCGSGTVRLWGRSVPGRLPDRTNSIPGDLATVWIDPSTDNIGKTAEVVAHEVGHNAGLFHIVPGGTTPLMHPSQGATPPPAFYSDPTPIAVPNGCDAPVQGLICDHNPTYHLRRYFEGEPESLVSDVGGGYDTGVLSCVIPSVVLTTISAAVSRIEPLNNLEFLLGRASSDIFADESMQELVDSDVEATQGGQVELQASVSSSAVGTGILTLSARESGSAEIDYFFSMDGVNPAEIDVPTEGSVVELDGELRRDLGGGQSECVGFVTAFVPEPGFSTGLLLGVSALLLVNRQGREFSRSR